MCITRLKKDILYAMREWKPRLVRCGVTQEEMANHMGMSKEAVHRWLNVKKGEFPPMLVSRFFQIEAALAEIEAAQGGE